MRVLITGSSGFVGSALSSRLAAEGHETVALVRRSPRSEAELTWNPRSGVVDPGIVDGADAVVHLAGENVASGRWTTHRRTRIRNSRVLGTRALAQAMAMAAAADLSATAPRTLVCASAIGFYGDRSDAILDESAAAGEGFLAGVCQEWEAAADPARAAGIRVVHLRIGLVLGTQGGALPRLFTLFRLGLGGRLGDGRQWSSWITIDDLVAVIRHTLAEDSLAGPVNAVSPKPVTNRGFAKALGRVLGRPTILPAPAFVLRLLLGQMADELLLASARVEPRALRQSGFQWADQEFEGALRRLLSPVRNPAG